MLRLHANALMKANIEALLKARGQTQVELARWCRRSESWISKIMSEPQRELPMKYFDRIADFFGIATYQLLQPGISPLTDRRAGLDRRTGRDRRLSQAVLSAAPGDVDVIHLIRALTRGGRERAIAMLADLVNDELRRPPAKSVTADGADRRREITAATPAPGRGLRKARPSGSPR